MESKTLIFVYGSLRRGGRHHGRMAGAEFVGERRTTPGYRVVRYEDGYPALVRAAGNGSLVQASSVSGETYWVDRAHLLRLDEFEECPRLYQRQRIVLEDGTAAEAYVIEPARAEGLPPIDERP